MPALISGALQFPTVIFSVALVAVGFYWGFVLLGALDVDCLDVDAELGLDVDADLDVDASHAASSGLFGVLQGLDLGSVPLTVTVSLWVLSSWTLTYLCAVLIGPAAATLAIGSGVAVAAGLGSLVVTAVGIVPVKGLFRSVPAQNKRDFVGKTCTVTTLRVNRDYGQAELDDGAAGVVIQVRCDGEEILEKGSTALVYRYDEERDVYFVKPVTPVAAI